MARQIFAGIIAGTVVSALAVGTISVMTDLPGRPSPEATALDVPAGSEFTQSREDTEASLPAGEDPTEAVAAPEMTAASPDDLSQMENADTDPAAVPETGMAEGDLSAPQAAILEPNVSVDSDSPVLPSPQSIAPDVPETEEDLSISTDPAQPALSDISEETAAFPTEETPEVPTSEDASAGMAEDDMTVVDGENAAVPEAGTQDPIAPQDDATPPEVMEEITEGTSSEPSSTIGNLAENVETGRLPSVLDAVDEEPAEAEDGGEVEQEPAENLPALQAFATPFENPDEKPLMSIVLIDDGRSPIGLDALASFPYPLNFAINPAAPGAEAAMRRYRDAGFEVLVMADLPETASANDSEVAMQVILSAVPEAVAVMEGTGTGLQASREASEQLAPILLESGHGLVLFSSGLDTAQKLIAREGVPVVTVFRDFDGKGQNATVIRRFLDQAAFKANRDEGGVIMLGRLRADTVSALLLWGLQDRANRVALAPVSAVLMGDR